MVWHFLKISVFYRVLFSFVGISVSLIAPSVAAESDRPICRPFAIYNGVKEPPAWKKNPEHTRASLSVSQLLKNISRVKGNESFETVFHAWEAKRPGEVSSKLKREWLECLSFYVHQDTDGDGIPDWSALSDGEPAFVLFPADDDIDGDGTPNVLDPDPFDPKVKGVARADEIPEHLKIRRRDGGELQQKLFQKFGIIAIDSTDEHSPVVLENLLYLLEHAFSGPFIRSLKSLRYIYAFSGHDAFVDIADYHHDAHAISIGGASTYGEVEKRAEFPQAKLLASLAHEIGHAFIFDHLTVADLRKLSSEIGGWAPVFGARPSANFYSSVFFTRHPLGVPGANNPLNRQYGLVSGYSLVGIHEWFSELFSAFALNRLGMHLLSASRPGKEYGFDSRHLPKKFSGWLGRYLDFELTSPFGNTKHDPGLPP